MDLFDVLRAGLSSAFGPYAIMLALAAIGLNIHFAYTGLLNFGQAGFMAVAGYGLAVSQAQHALAAIASQELGVPSVDREVSEYASAKERRRIAFDASLRHEEAVEGPDRDQHASDRRGRGRFLTGRIPTAKVVEERSHVVRSRAHQVDVRAQGVELVGVATVTDPGQRTAIKLELAVVFAITLGLAGARSLLSLTDSLLRPEPLAEQQVALHRPRAEVELIDLLQQLLGVVQLLGWAALGLYLLWRAGVALSAVGFGRRVDGRDIALGAGLAALIGIPGLAFYLAAWHAGINLEVAPSLLHETWWRPITLTLSAVGNAVAEEVLVVGLLLTRLRHLGVGENAALLVSALLRGAYHLYQGFGGFLGNFVMGLVFGRIWQRTNRLWPLVIAHALIDVVAFVGYALLRDSLAWLP
jgi:membrane protease YdiL (CAAX protease family)